MIKTGLVDELLEFHKCYNEKRLASEKPSYTEGIFQSIGFKEFHEYLILPEEKRNEASGKKALGKAIEDMKLVTRQYARKQMKWIVNRFLRKPDRQVPPVYGLDATNLDLWKENVLDPAAEIIQAVKKNRIPSQKPLPLQESLQDVPETHYCEVCDRIFVGRRTWEIHINSKKHSKIKASLKKADKKAKEQVIML
ncbi:tRNA dimethylallyltransferase-like [Stegodyphus dumicola]|uniref:tRNA dimethylallyltransferase-like n=1 Tax=Stegodyphus dumicola TaxID=202533 RepID=UPI0015A8DDAD|nr:tRNA dimethylallyltransferase-like [Stegodyphus dumicola]